MSIWPLKDPSFQAIFNEKTPFYKILKNSLVGTEKLGK